MPTHRMGSEQSLVHVLMHPTLKSERRHRSSVKRTAARARDEKDQPGHDCWKITKANVVGTPVKTVVSCPSQNSRAAASVQPAMSG